MNSAMVRVYLSVLQCDFNKMVLFHMQLIISWVSTRMQRRKRRGIILASHKENLLKAGLIQFG